MVAENLAKEYYKKYSSYKGAINGAKNNLNYSNRFVLEFFRNLKDLYYPEEKGLQDKALRLSAKKFKNKPGL